MVTITGIVALILVGVAFATSAILGGILQQNLDNRVRQVTSDAARELVRPFPPNDDVTAYDVLSGGGSPPGFVFVVQSGAGVDGAYVDDDNRVHSLSDEQVSQLTEGIGPSGTATVQIDGLGSYRVTSGVVGNAYYVVGGLPTSDVNDTIALIITTTLAVTAGGLLVLAGAIALVIRAGLAPLRAVADTATRVASLPLAQGAVSISERVPADQADEHTEIGRVGHALNTLLEHVDSSLDARQRNEERMRRFVADASHELRTPLASIRGYSELSLRALKQPDPSGAAETTEQSLERIQAQSLRMTALVEDLLLLARLDEGQDLVYGTVDLTRLAIEATGDARVAGPDHRWVIDVDDEPVLLAGDATRLHQVAANLLANARTHTPPGTTVTVGVTREGGEAVLRVHDDGPGVDAGILPELFARFARADRSRARQTGGTGLGLSIARAIVDAHAGTISVESMPGETTFTVRLPARPQDPQASDPV